MSDDKDLMDDLEDLGDDSSDSGDSGSSNSAPPKSDAGEKSSSDKRVNDLMGKWQAEQARANRLQTELEAAKGTAKSAGGSQGNSAGGADPAVSEFQDFVREDARRRLFDSDPRFASYGMDSSAITGSTLAEMKESVKRSKALLDGMETRVRGKVLEEHGLDPEVTAGGREPSMGIGEMSDSDFAKFLQERDSGRFR